MKTYLDTGVLSTAFRAKGLVKLETLPKTVYNQQFTEREFYQTFFDAVAYWANDIEQIVIDAYRVSCAYGLAAMDALHIAAALAIKAEEFITTEKLTKPMFRVPEIKVVTLMTE